MSQKPVPSVAVPQSVVSAEAVSVALEAAVAKAAELGVSVRTVHSRRARYVQQGLWGLVDQRGVREAAVTGRADARVVAAVRAALDAETNTSTGTRTRLMRRVVAQLESEHGPGVVPVPGRTAFYRLIDALATGRHSFGSAVTRRQTAAHQAERFARQPPHQIAIDRTTQQTLGDHQTQTRANRLVRRTSAVM